uniref:BHLH domain-containing protein n=1 Tax=Panagrolaimus sp. PS1159 TaxID=55785 RepID=A0AC35GUZ6_9BILA
MALYSMENWNFNNKNNNIQQQQIQFQTLETPSSVSRKARYQKKKKDENFGISENRVKRKKCPAKEKERNEAINSGFEALQSRIKCIQNGEKSSKIPKVKILRIAIRYINYLKQKLNTPDEFFNPSTDDFVLQAMDVIQTKNCYTKRATEEIVKDSMILSPLNNDAGYISPSQSITPPSNYSSDYFEIPPSTQISSSMDFSSIPQFPSNFYSNISYPQPSTNYVPQIQIMDYENYPVRKHFY